MIGEHEALAAASQAAEAVVTYRWASQAAEVAGHADVAALYRSLADVKLGNAFTLLGMFRDPPSLTMQLGLFADAEGDEAGRLEHLASIAESDADRDTFGRLAAACRAQADRLEQMRRTL